MSENLSDILARRLNQMGLGKAALAARICGAANKVGGAPPRGLCPAGSFEALSFKNGTLKIHVSSGARAHLIKMREREIISKINHELHGKKVYPEPKGEVVERLRFEIS